jgi:hypothetical protein
VGFKPLKVASDSAEDSGAEAQASIDAFIEAKLKEKGLTPLLVPMHAHSFAGSFSISPAFRPLRLTCQTGRTCPTNLRKARGHLLASPRHGERWARHWLDAVHYGETHGYDKDKPRINAWPYRDYVIRAFNNDKPYARFIEEQIAGRCALSGHGGWHHGAGFHRGGAVGLHRACGGAGDEARWQDRPHLDRDDMVQNAIGTFCSLTVQCAQCHNHKFDPISQEDYYSLQAVFAAIDRTEVDYYPDDASMQKFAALQKQKKQLADEIAALEAPLKKKPVKPTPRSASASTARRKKARIRTQSPTFGWHSAISPTQDAVKWVQVDLGKSVQVERIVLKPCYDDYGKIGGGFGFPVRFKIEVSDDPGVQNRRHARVAEARRHLHERLRESRPQALRNRHRRR